MRYFVTALLLGVLLPFPCATVFSQALEPGDLSAVANDGGDQLHLSWCTTTFDLAAGYRKDKLNWHIAGTLQGSNPNVLSELTWSGIQIHQLKLANRTVIKDLVYLRCHLDYGVAVTGDNQDSDYLGDNRTREFSRSTNAVDGNDVWDGSAGIGPRWSFFESSLLLCPLLGYAVSEQDLNIVDGYQALTNPPATTPLGPFAGLDSRYETRWKGPWIGADLWLLVPCKSGPLTVVGVQFSCEYHWLEYDAEANWNLRADFDHPVSFTHEADGNGWVTGASILFQMKNRWGINLGMHMKDMTTDAGLDRTYYADGTKVDTRLNEVRWRSYAFEAGLSYRF